MALHESELTSYVEVAAEAQRLRLLTQELHDALVKPSGRIQGSIITIRPTQVEDAPQKLRVQSKG